MATIDPAYRYALNKYAGDGHTTDWQLKTDGGYDISTLQAYSYLTLDYSDQQPLTVTVIGTSGDTSTVRVSPAVPVGRTLVLSRFTQRDVPLVDFVNRSMLTEDNLNTIARQAIFAVAELSDSFAEFELEVGDKADLALSIAREANDTADDANATADAALARANDAYAKGVNAEAGIAAATTAANAATASANAANQAASDATILVTGIQATVDAAVVTANAAAATANQASDVALGLGDEIDAAVTTANAAAAQVAVATTTANEAKTTADGVDAKATLALSNSVDAQTTANAATAAVSDKVSKTVTADQAIVSNLLTSLSVRADGGYFVRKDRPTTGTTNLLTSTNAAGAGTAAGIRHTTAATQVYSGSAVFTLSDAGPFSMSHQLTIAAPLQTAPGAVGTQQFHHRFGWSDGVTRFAEVMETTGGMSWYTYNASGGNPIQVMYTASQNSGYAGGPLFRFAGKGQFGGTTTYSNSDAVNTAHVLAQGQYPCVAWQDNTTSGNVRSLYYDPAVAAMQFYNVATASIVSSDTLSGFSHVGGFQVISDERTKYCLRPLKADWDAFMAVKPQSGKYRKHFCDDGGKRHMFLVAQDVLPHYPELVKAPQPWDHIPDLLTVDYDQGVPVLWKMVQELRRELDELKEARK